MDIMTHAKFHFNRLMLTLIFGIRASEPLWAWQTTEKARPDRVKRCGSYMRVFTVQSVDFFRFMENLRPI